MEEAEGDFKVRRFTCLGRRASGGGELMILFRLADADRLDGVGGPASFNAKKLAKQYPFHAGGVYEMEATAGGERIRPKTARFAENHPDGGDRGAWQLADRAAVAARDAERENKKLGKRPDLAAALAPLRRQWQKTPGPLRPAFELAVLALLRRRED